MKKPMCSITLHAPLLLALVLAVSAPKLSAADGVSLIEGKTADGQAVLTVKHPAYSLEIYPAQGGRGVLTNSAAGELTALDKNGVSFFRECFSEAAIEATPPVVVFTHTVDKNDGKIVVLSLQATLTKETAGADLDGVVLKRRITVDAARPVIAVTEELSNPTKETRYASLGIQNRFWIEKFGNDFTYLPTTRNVLDVSKSGSVFGYYGKGGDWEYEPVEGWLGVCDPASKRGIAFVMDYNVLESFYAGTQGAGGVRGWSVDMGELLPQAVVATQYQVIPVQGFSSFAYASERLVAEIRVVPQKEKVLVNQTVEALQPLTDVTLEGAVVNVRSGGVRTLEAAHFDKLDAAQVVSKQGAVPGAMTEPVVVRVKAKGKDGDSAYEVMAEGPFHAQPIPNLMLAVESRRQAPERQPIKRLAEGVAVTPSTAVAKERRVLLFYGVYTQWYKLEDAVKGWDVKVSNARPAKAEYLPPAAEIAKYALVVLSDVTADALPASVIRRLEGYVKKGGSLLVLGGPYAYGHGRYGEKGLEVMLPVEGHAFDLIWDKAGVPFRQTKEHVILKGVALGASPMVYWHHQVKVKKSGEVLLAAGDYNPLLVVQAYGTGKVACFLGSPLGDPPQGQMPFWDWDGWPILLKNTVGWLTDAEVK